MKIKYIKILALMLVVGAFLLPTSALANVYYAEIPDISEISTELPEEVSLPDETPESSPWAQSPWDEPENANPFTPDGTATVTDNATSDDGKEFFTFTTPEGNVFFLVIDRSRPTNNVYFLNAVTEQDLMALAEVSDNEPDVFAPIPTPLPTPEPLPGLDDEAEAPDIPIETEPPSNNGTLIFAVLAALAFGGTAYYLKIVRPKKQGGFDDEDERIPLTPTTTLSEPTGGGIEKDDAYKGSGYENAAADIERVIAQMAEKSVHTELEHTDCNQYYQIRLLVLFANFFRRCFKNQKPCAYVHFEGIQLHLDNFIHPLLYIPLHGERLSA